MGCNTPRVPRRFRQTIICSPTTPSTSTIGSYLFCFAMTMNSALINFACRRASATMSASGFCILGSSRYWSNPISLRNLHSTEKRERNRNASGCAAIMSPGIREDTFPAFSAFVKLPPESTLRDMISGRSPCVSHKEIALPQSRSHCDPFALPPPTLMVLVSPCTPIQVLRLRRRLGVRYRSCSWCRCRL